MLEWTRDHPGSFIRTSLWFCSNNGMGNKADLDYPGNASSHESPAKYGVNLVIMNLYNN